jgi:hypothetical protein
MTKTYDNSLLEVLKWKEEVANSIKDMSIQERLKKFEENSKKRLELKHSYEHSNVDIKQ